MRDSLAEALLVDHLVGALVCVAADDLPVVAVMANVLLMQSSDGAQRRHSRALVATHDARARLSLRLTDRDRCALFYGLHSGTALDILQLVEHVGAIVARLPHALVEVIERRVAHLESFG